jgi:hypothetical protein
LPSGLFNWTVIRFAENAEHLLEIIDELAFSAK